MEQRMWFVVYALDVQLNELDDDLVIGRSKRIFVTAHACIRRALNMSNIG
jgi:hypothetical protein